MVAGRYISRFLAGLLAGVMLFFSGCSKEDDPEPPTHIFTIPSALYFQARIDGIPYLLSTDEGSYTNVTSHSFEFDSTAGFIQFKSGFQKENAVQANVEFHNYYWGDSIMDPTEFMSLFGIGRREFYARQDSSSPGIIISWTDANEQTWTSDLFTQDSAIFNVDQNEFGQNSLTHTARLSVSFKCRLWNSAGIQIEVEEGKCVIFYTKPVF